MWIHWLYYIVLFEIPTDEPVNRISCNVLTIYNGHVRVSHLPSIRDALNPRGTAIGASVIYWSQVADSHIISESERFWPTCTSSALSWPTFAFVTTVSWNWMTLQLPTIGLLLVVPLNRVPEIQRPNKATSQRDNTTHWLSSSMSVVIL